MNKITSKQGYVFATKDKKEVYGNIMYLGLYDSKFNYIEIPISEAEQIKKEIEENLEKERIEQNE
jgi:hypothetical protein